jgi:peptidoglycan hydrolase CwlO-like protein
MEEALKRYVEAINNIPRDVYIKGEIHDCQSLIKLCEKDIEKCNDPEEIAELKKEIEDLHHMIDDWNEKLKSDEDITINLTDIETNMF